VRNPTPLNHARLPTIRDVAAAAGVSPAAVSRHLNRSVVLPAETASRIDSAVAALNYRPNIQALRLSRGITQMIGVVTPDIAYPFFAMIASAAEEEASRFGYSVVICNTRNQIERELDYLDKLAWRHVDGLIFLTNHADDGTLGKRLERLQNVVLLDEDVAGTVAPKIFIDNHMGGLLATRHLIEQGHRRLAHVTGPAGVMSVKERFAGFRQAMAEAGLPVDEALVKFGAYDEAWGAEAFRQLFALAERPSAVFLASDALALGMLAACRAAGVAVPRSLSLVGFDDLPFVRYLDPPLTTVRQPAEELGRCAVRRLIETLRGLPVPDRPERLPVELVVRGSVAGHGSHPSLR